jgi:hypothetical protein
MAAASWFDPRSTGSKPASSISWAMVALAVG